MKKSLIFGFIKIISAILFSALFLAGGVELVQRFHSPDKTEKNPPREEPRYSRMEEFLGDLSYQALLAEYPLIEDPRIEDFFSLIHQTLTAHHFDPDKRLEHLTYYLADDGRVNAFALPAGKIVVTRGMIRQVENTEELSSVIAHELGHIQLGHVMKKLKGEMGLAVLIAIATGGEASGAVSRIIQSLVSSRYSRTLETRADEFSARMLFDAGLDPQEIVRFFQRMGGEGRESHVPPEILSTHPEMEKRISHLLEYMKAFRFWGRAPQTPALPGIESFRKMLTDLGY